MVKSYLYKSLKNKYFPIAIIIMYIMMLFNNCGYIFDVRDRTTFISAYISKMRGMWVKMDQTTFLYHLDSYLPGDNKMGMMLPVLSCLPFFLICMSEIESGNKRFVLIRTDKKKYYFSQILCQFIVSFTIVFSAVCIFELTNYFFLDSVNKNDEIYLSVFNNASGWKIERVEQVLAIGIVKRQAKLYFFYILYVFKCAMFCKAISAITKDKYYTIGLTVTLYYFLQRLSEEIVERGTQAYSKYNDKLIRIGDSISPEVLLASGRHFTDAYGNQWIAMLVTVFMIFLWSAIYIYVSEKNLDIAMV